MLGTALLEPFFYHPRTVWWAVVGNFDYLRGVRNWGKMERQGFGKQKKDAKERKAESIRQIKAEQEGEGSSGSEKENEGE